MSRRCFRSELWVQRSVLGGFNPFSSRDHLIQCNRSGVGAAPILMLFGYKAKILCAWNAEGGNSVETMDCLGPDLVSDLKVKVEKSSIVYPSKATKRRRMFLSNIDQVLVFTVETLHFFAGNPQMAWKDIVQMIESALSRVLVAYDFMAGRLKFNTEQGRFEIDCCGAGALFAAASSGLAIQDLQDITFPNPAFRQLILQEYAVQSLEELPLCLLQVTRFKCGGFAIGLGTNHTVLDGIAAVGFMKNLASLAAGKDLATIPYTDRTLLKARSPPRIEYEHPELIKLDEIPQVSTTFTKRGSEIPQDGFSSPSQLSHDYIFRRFQVSYETLNRVKAAAKTKCTSFEAVTAHLWRSRTLALGMAAEESSTVLFAVDMRSRMNPPLPREYAGNAVFPAYATATVKEMEEESLPLCVHKVQEGVRRLSDEYLRSCIDWGEVHKGVPRFSEGSTFVSSWWRLGFEDVEYPWGKAVHYGPVVHQRVDMVLLTPTTDENRAVNVFLALQSDQMPKFERLFQTL